MRVFLILLVVLMAWPSHGDAREPADVTVYGAPWCGPCKRLRSYLDRNRVAYRYVDIDRPANLERYYRVSPGGGGIPFTVIGRETIRGARLSSVENMLQRNGYEMGAIEPSPSDGEERYGGKPPSWWVRQFTDMRRRLARAEERLENADNVVGRIAQEQARERAERRVDLIEASLQELEIDAKHVSLPHQYRAY